MKPSRLFLTTLLTLLAVRAGADILPPLPPADMARWSAVGVVNAEGAEGSATCTGTLVASDLVLTAAHCVGGYSGPTAARRFVIGGVGEAMRASFVSIRTDTHPDYVKSTDRAGYLHDLGVIQLAAHVPPDLATPVPLAGQFADIGPGVPVAMLGYHRFGPGGLNGRFDCAAGAESPDQLLELHCKVVSGNSGAPVLIRQAGRWQIMAVVVATLGRGPQSSALATRTDDWVADQIFGALARAN